MLSVAERHKYILDHLNKYGFVRITDVANELGVTKVTIRKDVKILEAKGLLYKVHGSARSANPHVADTDVHVKGNVNREEKERIARKAVELLNDNDSIIMAFGIDDLCVRRGDQARVPLASQRGDHVPQNLGAAQRRRGDQRRAAGRVRPQEVVVGDRRLRRGGAERFQLLEALLRGRRHRS